MEYYFFNYLFLAGPSLLQTGFLQLLQETLVAVHGLLIALASFGIVSRLRVQWAAAAAAHGLDSCGSRAVEHRFSCPTACGIFPGIRPMSPAWKVDS